MKRRLQVIQGGKGKPPSLPEAPLRLFKARSTGNLVRESTVYYDVAFNWYCLERNEPPAPYEQLIAGYEALDNRRRALLEADVNRYLTAAESNALKAYLLGKHGLEASMEEIPLPIEGRTFLTGAGARNVVYDFLELSEEEGYSLSFKIWGYYTTTNCLSSPSLEKGVEFVEKSLELLGFDPEISQNRLYQVVKALYDRYGLYVAAADIEESPFQRQDGS